ncbi:MAG TPA: hypothetical protein PLO78_10195 [Candidatus Omnitrophota bacterium]|nr:hypothetical protein [Candidatus Omnitrophota bacterium]
MKAVAFLKPFRIDDINVGSAKLLKGKILLGHVFIQRTPDEWDQKRIATVLQRVEQATQWIEGQAQNYKMEVVFDNFLVQEPFLRFLNAIPCHKNRFRSWNAFEAILADAAEEVVARAKENHIENLMLMAHVNEAVRSYAVPKRLGDGRPINFIEYCVCSTFYSAASYAHEILHLFGADDFYIEFYTKLGDYRKEFLQGSIMLSAKSLEGVRIDDLTAQNIGWL